MLLGRPTSLRGFRASVAGSVCAVVTICSAAGVGGDEGLNGRLDLQSVKPLATCALKTINSAPAPEMARGLVYSGAPTVVDDPLANYARTPLGDWQMPVEVDRENPWLRFVLFSVERPLVIDVAVFVDGKPYADGREAWIEGVLEEAKGAKEAKSASGKKTSETKVTTIASTQAASENNKEVKVEAKTDGKKVIAAKVSEAPKVAAQSRQAPSMRERLLAYVSTPGPAVDRREIRWLIAEWGFGPPVVVLDSSRSWQRASVAPLFAYLDRDRSGALESAEIAGAEDSLRQADADANDVVEEQELRRQSDAPPVMPFVTDHPLVVAIDEATDREALAAELGRIYGMNAEQVEATVGGAADATLRVDFGDAKPQAAGVALLGVGPGIAGSATDDVITLDAGAAYVECSAAAGAAANVAAADVVGTQIAVGAAIDGNPFLRLLDSDQDHRLTVRERQQLASLLATCDRDHDGQLAARELPIPIRFAVTLGPQVHTLLAQPTGAARSFAPVDAARPPEWFASMDKNRDRDLSRGEFLGTAEQFGQFDADADGLVSIVEAQKMDSEQ